jgi:tyrosyl-tRNA synthetase
MRITAMNNLFDTLEARGFIQQYTDPKLREILGKEKVTVYIGFDPTASSLHLGTLLPIMGLVHCQRHGHRPIALMGGGTGMIGDPSGKAEERSLLSLENIEYNVSCIRRQFERFLDFQQGENPALMLNNADWLTRWGFIEFLRDIGKHFNINYMLAKDSVKRRIADPDKGMSFTEFSYMLLQAYDFYYLRKEHGCAIQMGGSDQWGNITAGIELIRKLMGAAVYGITFPLLTTSAGEKFGKSEKGTPVWLDPGLTSPYQMYQYLVRTDDRDVIRYLRLLTLVPMDEIDALESSQGSHPETREAHRRLAYEVTRMVHGPDAADAARRAARVLYGEEIADMNDALLREIFSDVPFTPVSRDGLGRGIMAVDAFHRSGLCGSRSEARRLIQGGGAYINNRRIDSVEHILTAESLASEHFIVLRKGKKDYHLLMVE